MNHISPVMEGGPVDTNSFSFSVDIREIDNGYIVRIGNSGVWTEHAFVTKRAIKIPEFISQRLLMVLEEKIEGL